VGAPATMIRRSGDVIRNLGQAGDVVNDPGAGRDGWRDASRGEGWFTSRLGCQCPRRGVHGFAPATLREINGGYAWRSAGDLAELTT
jgi:hypothetical protein